MALWELRLEAAEEHRELSRQTILVAKTSSSTKIPIVIELRFNHSCSMRSGAMEDMRSPQLPYLTQDQWTCDRKTENIDVWTMESEDLKYVRHGTPHQHLLDIF